MAADTKISGQGIHVLPDSDDFKMGKHGSQGKKAGLGGRVELFRPVQPFCGVRTE
jgi:hypothetical protein